MYTLAVQQVLFLGSHFLFRVVMAFVLIHCWKCKIKTLIVDGKDRLGFCVPSIEDAVKITSFCIEHNIPSNRKQPKFWQTYRSQFSSILTKISIKMFLYYKLTFFVHFLCTLRLAVIILSSVFLRWQLISVTNSANKIPCFELKCCSFSHSGSNLLCWREQP